MVEQDMSSNKRSKMVAGVSVRLLDDGDADYDELLREALRIALRIDTHPTHDDFNVLHTRITELMDAYIHGPEGADVDTAFLMARLAVCLIDVIPLEERKQRLRRAVAN
jgi:hypothetical protein